MSCCLSGPKSTYRESTNVNWRIDRTSWLSSGWVAFWKETAPACRDILYPYMYALTKLCEYERIIELQDDYINKHIPWKLLSMTQVEVLFIGHIWTTHIIISTKDITPNSGLLPLPTSFTSTDGCTISNDVGLEVKLFLGIHTIGAKVDGWWLSSWWCSLLDRKP